MLHSHICLEPYVKSSAVSLPLWHMYSILHDNSFHFIRVQKACCSVSGNIFPTGHSDSRFSATCFWTIFLMLVCKEVCNWFSSMLTKTPHSLQSQLLYGRCTLTYQSQPPLAMSVIHVKMSFCFAVHPYKNTDRCVVKCIKTQPSMCSLLEKPT